MSKGKPKSGIDSLISEEIAGEATGKINPGKNKLIKTGQFEMMTRRKPRPGEPQQDDRPVQAPAVQSAHIGQPAPSSTPSISRGFMLIVLLIAALTAAGWAVYHFVTQ